MRSNVTEKVPFSNAAGLSARLRAARCPGWESNPHGLLRPGDFKSPASDQFRHPGIAGTISSYREATAGIEPAVEDLQSPELPLFYVASAAFASFLSVSDGVLLGEARVDLLAGLLAAVDLEVEEGDPHEARVVADERAEFGALPV